MKEKVICYQQKSIYVVNRAIAVCLLNLFVSCSHYTNHYSLKVMLLGSSLQLPQRVLVIPSPSHVLSEVRVGSHSGEWVGAVSVSYHIIQEVPLVLVDLAALLQLHLELDLEQVLHPSHQH